MQLSHTLNITSIMFQDRLFCFDAMKKTLALLVSPDDCENLRKYFGVTEVEMMGTQAGGADKSKKLSAKEETVQKMEFLLTIIEEKGYLDSYNFNILTEAVSSIGHELFISHLKGPMEGYAIHGSESHYTFLFLL